MTDKEQIIINGVDVGECEYLTYQLEEDGQYYWFCKISPTGGPDECEYNPECFYKRVLKQLAHKTQECEELKEWLQANQPTGICETCMAKAILQNDEYRKALEEIEKIIASTDAGTRPKLYDFENDTKILDIINKARKCI